MFRSADVHDGDRETIGCIQQYLYIYRYSDIYLSYAKVWRKVYYDQPITKANDKKKDEKKKNLSVLQPTFRWAPE